MSALMLFSMTSCGNDTVSDAIIDAAADALIDDIEDPSNTSESSPLLPDTENSFTYAPEAENDFMYIQLPGDSSHFSSPDASVEEAFPSESQTDYSDEEVLPSESTPEISPEQFPLQPDLFYESSAESSAPVEEGEYYYDLENVVLYLEYYGCLPENYITKDEARDLGWSGGTPERFLEGSAIGGDKFGNREKLLPTEKGRTYTECDLNTNGADSRGAERLVFSNDGLYFHTEDHYEHFTEYTVTEDWQVVPW